MPRARNLKPGFFSNEDLAECSPWARLCFAGLWTLADREGRLEDRPKRIKGELFRFDTVDVEPLLQELERFKFILRYEIDGDHFIQIPEFKAHQSPHYSEKQSVIKPPQLQETSPHRDAPVSGSVPGVEAASRGGRNPLNPESRILNPDSLNPEATTSVVVGARPSDDPPTPPALTLVENPKTSPPDCPHRALLALWAEVLPALPQHDPEQWRGARCDHLRARWRETCAAKRWASEADGITYFRRLFAYVGQSQFLTGRTHDPKRRPFFCELAWLVKPANWAAVIEGKYHPEAVA